uniref:ShKT domain-containing protein n=1 Tax=Ditylenchus dipsaci TaxID=166011 RepID=A0A915DZ59_9BILA
MIIGSSQSEFTHSSGFSSTRRRSNLQCKRKEFETMGWPLRYTSEDPSSQQSSSNISDEDQGNGSLGSGSTGSDSEFSSEDSSDKNRDKGKQGNRNSSSTCLDKRHPITGLHGGIWLSVMRTECPKTCKICT